MSEHLPLQDSILLFEDERLPDKKKKAREVARVYVLKTELDKLLFNTNIMIYACKYPETKNDCVLCVYDTIGEEAAITKAIEKFDGYGIQIEVINTSYKSRIQEFLNA